MKTRESGMPDETLWSSFFSPSETLKKLGLSSDCGDVMDFGCGYGTFVIPAARIARGIVYALDIEPEMIEVTQAKARAANLTNVRASVQDFVAEGTGLPEASVDYAMLFNILHLEDPMTLLIEAHRVLRPEGLLGIMHWNYEPATPRGPSMAIRPRPDQCRQWAEEAGFWAMAPEPIPLPPYHYGYIMKRP